MLKKRPAIHFSQTQSILALSPRQKFVDELRRACATNTPWSVISASAADEAVGILRTTAIASVILDETDGNAFAMAAAQTLRRDLEWPSKAIPQILVAVKPTLRTIRQAIEAGIDEVLAAPVTQDTLNARVVSLCVKQRGLVSTEKYVGPCRRRGAFASPAHPLERRQDDKDPRRLRQVNRYIRSYLELYHTGRLLADLVSPSMLLLDTSHLREGLATLREGALRLDDGRLCAIAQLLLEGLTILERDSKQRLPLTLAIRDLIKVLEHRIRKLDSRLEQRANVDVLPDHEFAP